MMVKILYISSTDNGINPIINAINKSKNIDTLSFSISIYLRENIKDNKFTEILREIPSSNLIIIHLMGGKDSLFGIDRILKTALHHRIPVHVQSTATGIHPDLFLSSTVSKDEYETIQKYINYGGDTNYLNLFLWAVNRFDGAVTSYEEPTPMPWQGIYLPGEWREISLREYIDRFHKPGRITIGIIFYRSYWLADNTAFVDAFIDALKRNNVNALPVFLQTAKDPDAGAHGFQSVVEEYFMESGRPIIDAMISTLMFSQFMFAGGRDEDIEKFCLARLGVPVIKAILSHTSMDEWSGLHKGLSPLDVGMNMALPEFDGNIISVPVATREVEIRGTESESRIFFRPVPDRIDAVVRRAVNWAKLRHIPNSSKKVAIILHNYPPRDAMIGTAVGLDSAESVWNILRELKNAGYFIEFIPPNGQELIGELRKRVTNDRQWISEEKILSLATASVPSLRYNSWFSTFPGVVQEQVRSHWGSEPGTVFYYKDRLIVPGIINGNIFIGLQPPRGFGEDPEKIYHSPETPPTHHYVAYYRWISETFKADAIIHIGTHGTLEWLPGKSAGLSKSCFPDLVIHDLPHIYHYIINNPGEGAQAKRRSYACIIDYLIPVMTNADSYDDLAELEVHLEDYYRTRDLDPQKIPYLREIIWEKVCKSHLDQDLHSSKEIAFTDFNRFLADLHGYIHEMKDTLIKDGMHILGEPPHGQDLVEMLVALTRLANGNIPSLRQAVSHALGFDYEDLLLDRGKYIHEYGKTHGQLLDMVHETGVNLITELAEKKFDTKKIPGIIHGQIKKSDKSIEQTLTYVATTLLPKINGTRSELSHTIHALEGRYILPGPSGVPSRGMADILPTGRNFFTLDPFTIPTVTAWEVGKALGDALLERYLSEEGKYPENIGIVVWGFSTMRNRGEDIAEALYLMGIKPLWEQRNGRTRGFSIIPLEELQRPRIDVTLRISGLFRDAFSNVISWLDEAIEQVASLPESPRDNFLAKHVRKETEENILSGMDEQTARKNAGYRIFGCKPGSYGTGISQVIESQNWDKNNDLAQIYVTWGGYAYGREEHGKVVSESFRKRLGTLDLAVKNDDSREYDLFDSNDWYAYFGGLIAAIKEFKEDIPRSYMGDSSDPDHVRMRSTAEEAKHVFRSRVFNPKWINSMKKHGYKGAGDMAYMIDNIFGMDATTDVIDDWMYEGIAERYVLDPEMKKWMKDTNPDALSSITERLLESIQRNMWDADSPMKERLLNIFLEIEGYQEEKYDETPGKSAN